MSVIRVPLHVTYSDGTTVDLEALPLEIMEFERKFNLPMSVFGDPAQQRLEHLMFVAYAATKRRGNEESFDEWAAKVAGVEPSAEEADGSDPLDPSQSTGS